MKMFEVAEDGDLRESPFKKENVESGKVYIFINDEDKQIVLWSGKDAKTRNKFIGARLASGLRLEHGLSYKLTQVDEAETPDYLKSMNAKPSPARLAAPPAVVPRPEVSPPPQPSRTPTQQRQQSMTTGGPTSVSPRGQQFQIPVQKAESDQNRIVERLNSIETPKGFERELVVIGHDMFAVSVSKTRVFGKEKVDKKIGKVTNPLEDGIFLAEEYTPRVIIENGRVLAVEFLKGSSQLQKKVERERPASREVSAEEPLESMMEKHLSEITGIFRSSPKKKETGE